MKSKNYEVPEIRVIEIKNNEEIIMGSVEADYDDLLDD